MKNFILACTISFALHIIILYNFQDIDIKKPIYQPSSQKETALKYTHIQLASIKPTPKVIKEFVKKVVTKKIPKKIIKIKKEILQKKKIQINKVKKIIDINKEKKEIQKLDRLTQSYIKLYGQKYFNLPEDVKKYLKENLNEIGQITQEYLRYPSIAIKMKQSGTNILEFTLKPNGDITNLRIIRSSQHNILDKNSIKTIKMAYKDYPLPTKNTLIRIYVSYVSSL